MNIKYLGHSCFQVTINNENILFDPFISPNEKASHIDVNSIEAEYILLTHGHGDHVADAEKIAQNNDSTIVSNFEIVSWYQNKGLKGHPMNHGGKWKFSFGSVKYVNAIHSSALPDGTYGGNPGGFLVWNDEVSFYHAGDTALTLDMKLIPELCPKLDFAILPIGDNFTMGYEDAVKAAKFIECDIIVGCHFDTFGPIEIDHEAAINAFTDAGKTLILPQIGQLITI